MKEENTIGQMLESLGELNEMQEIEKREQKAKEIQLEVTQAKVGEDVLVHEKGILVICKDAKEK